MKKLVVALLLLLSLLWAGPVSAQAVHDTHATGTYVSGTSFSWSHTIASGGKVLVFVGYKFAALETITGVTVGGSAATFVAGVQNAGGGNRLELWKHESPTSGSQTIQVTFNGNLGGDSGLAVAISISSTATNSFAAATTAGPTASTTPAVTVPSVGANDIPYACDFDGGDPTQQDTAIAELSGDSGTVLNCERQSAGGDGVLNWTEPSGSEWVTIGTRALGSAGGGGGSASRLPLLGVN